MKKQFSQVASDVFDKIQFEAGILLTKFDPAKPAKPADGDIICCTDGGVNPKCVPNYIDFGEDMDNVPAKTKELMQIDSWDCSLGFTALDITPDVIKLSLGAADISEGKIIPRMDVEASDFHDIWWVGDRTDGGWAAIKLMNALSADGFSLQTTKKGKGKLSVSLNGHYSLKDTSIVPMEFYVEEGSED